MRKKVYKNEMHTLTNAIKATPILPKNFLPPTIPHLNQENNTHTIIIANHSHLR
jgi:hypothetical protein